jgi:hypothetical protein
MTRLVHRIMKPVLPVSRCSIEGSPREKVRRHKRLCGPNQKTDDH